MKTILKLILSLLVLTSCTDEVVVPKHILIEVTSTNLLRTYPTCIRDGQTSEVVYTDDRFYTLEEAAEIYKDNVYISYGQFFVGEITPDMVGKNYRMVHTYTYKLIEIK